MINNRITTIIDDGIHIGDKTHTQLHVMTLVNFKTMKIKHNILKKPIPPELLFIFYPFQ